MANALMSFLVPKPGARQVIPNKVLFVVCLLLLFFVSAAQTVKRGRDEGTISTPASNVMGNGNLTLYLESIARYSLSGFNFDPVFGAQIGISDILQLSGQFIPLAKKGLGPTEAHLQLTTPGNDNLRFFGLALRADLFLSSTQDTLSSTAQSDKPEYNPYLFASCIADFDWLSVWKSFPIKTYLSVGMVDNIELLPFFDQLSVRSAFEWKMYKNSLFFDFGGGLFKEKRNKKTPGDGSYAQSYFWIEPGGRYRFWGRCSIIGSTKLTLFQKVKQKNPITPELFNISVKLEAPLLLKEMNTEVIRTLIFMEEKKEKTIDSLEKKVAAGKSLVRDINASLFNMMDSVDGASVSEEKDALKKRREDTYKKMDEIERLFLQLDNKEKKTHLDSAVMNGRSEE
jgi:hypothetical protein